MHPGLIIGAIALGWAALQSRKPSPEPEVGKDPAPKAGETTESTTADGTTVQIGTVDGAAKVEPTTDKASAGALAEPGDRGAPGSGTPKAILTAPGPGAVGAATGVGLATAAASLGAVSPFAGLGAYAATSAAKAGLATSTITNTTRRQAVAELMRIGPAVGAIW